MSSSARAGRSGENFPSTISSSFSDGARSQLFWLGNDTPVAALGEPVQGQLQALRIEFRSLGHAMSFMQENDRAGFDFAEDLLGYQDGLALNRVQPPHGPTDQRQPAPFQGGMHKRVLQTRRRPEQKRRTIRPTPKPFRAAIDLRGNFRRTSRPKHSTGMRIGVIGDRVAATENFRDEVWKFFRALTDNEERRARVKALEEVEDLGGVGGGGAVVDRDPDFLFGGGKGANDRPPPLAIGNERRVKKQEMGNKERRQRDDEMRSAEVKREDRGGEREPQERAPHQGRAIFRDDALHRKRPE